MEEKSRYLQIVWILLAAFCLVCVTWFVARRSSSEPYRVTTVQHPTERSYGEMESGLASNGEEKSYPDSLFPGEILDINQADFYDLQRLPGIGEKRAQDIISYREEHGPFQSVEELTQVSGIGPGILAGIQEYITTGNE